MREWFTPKELAGLPELPNTARRVRSMANRERWKSRKRSGRGGGFEYHIDSLPEKARAALIVRHHRQSPAASSPAGGPGHQADGRPTPTAPFEYCAESLWNRFERLPKHRKDEAHQIALAVDSALEMIARDVPARDAWTAAAEAIGKTRSTLQRWHQLIKKYHRSDWPAAAVKSYKGRTKKTPFDRRAWDYLLGDYLRLEQPTLSACYRRLIEVAEQQGWSVPPERTVHRRIKAFKRANPGRFTLLREGEGALMRMYPALQRSVADLHALQWINGDGYQHNVFVRWPDGKIARPKTWFWQDVYSRKILGFRTDETEHSDMIRLALGDVVERYGIPEHATIDNTRAAANKWLTGGVPNRYRFTVREDDPLGLLPSLGVKVHWTSVHNGRGHGQAKPVERMFKSEGGIGDDIDKHPEFQGAFTGKDPMKKPENHGSRAVDLETFIRVATSRIREWNARTGRCTEMAGGRLSFNQVFEESYRHAPIRKATAAQRRLWLLKAEKVRVAHDGSVMLSAGGVVGVGRNRYSSDALHSYVGQLVSVRFDPHQLHGTVYAYDQADQFIGECECIAPAGYGDTQRARKHNRQRKAWMAAEKEKAKLEQAMSAQEVARMLPEYPEEETAESGVIQPRFGELMKKAAGSDIDPDIESDDDQATRERAVNRVIEHAFEQRFKDEI
jgi:hypothetical protein